MEKKTTPLSKEEDHPFDKILGQIEQLLTTIDQNKGKAVVDVPDWIFKELDELQKNMDKFQKTATQAFPNLDIDEKKFRKLMRSLPKSQQPEAMHIAEKARALKEKAEVIQRDYHLSLPNQELAFSNPLPIEEESSEDSPMKLFQKDKGEADQKKDLQATLENKRKFGRMGGRKNWRPI